MSFRRLGSRVKNFAEQRHDRQRKLKRQHSRQHLVQQLEDRRLLAGPELIAIRPDAGALLFEGDTLSIAPREFNLQFKAGADLDETTITSESIKLVRSGGDGTFGDGNEVDVVLGYVGLEDPGNTDPTNLQRIVFRTSSAAAFNATEPANAFPDDTYQIQVLGAGTDALMNRSGEAFNEGADQQTTFSLDRGAQVVSVVPQPISHAPLSQASDEIVVYFDDQPLDPAKAIDPSYYRLVNTSASLTGSDDTTTLPKTVTYDSAANRVTLKFESAIPEGTYRLDIGLSGGDSSTLSGAIQIGTLTGSSSYSANGYLGDSGGVSNDASDLDLYGMQLRAGGAIRVTVTPHDQDLGLQARLLDAGGGELDLASLGPGETNVINFSVAVSGDYFIEITSADGSTGSYGITTRVTSSPLSTNDDNSTFASATTLGSLGAASLRITSSIRQQSIPLPPRAGSEDEPGHRQIQRESHTGITGTTPAAPTAISVVTYYFPDTLGTDPSGADYPNLISEKEKQIVREIFEYYARISGTEFVESLSTTLGGGGRLVGKGDLRAFDPTMGPDSGVAGLGGPGGVLLNGAIFNQSARFYGDGFTGTMFHEIGHSMGLGHAYDLPANMGSALPDSLLTGDHDVVHLQRVDPPNATDIDMYQFTLVESGRLTVETIAERLATTSLLNTAVTLYRQTDGNFELIARNDQYFGADSFLELNLEPGDYFIGVSSTGNTDYDPRVPDSGFGGSTDGIYDLSIQFEADVDGVLTDATGTPIDGDADGTPGGVYSFWFQASDTDTTLFVNKLTDTTVGPEGSGTLSDPYDTIDFALEQAGNRIVVPLDGATSIADGESFVIDDGLNKVRLQFGAIVPNSIDLSGATNAQEVAVAIESAINNAKTVGQLSASVGVSVSGRVVQLTNIDNLEITQSPTLINTPNLVHLVADGGLDQDVDTLEDNRPYLVGVDVSGNPLPDGAEFLVPQGVGVMIQAGALFKMRRANIDAGSSSANISRSHSSIQVLGTPERSVFFRSYHNDSVGGDSDGVGPAANSGDFGGIVFRDDSDLESAGVFLNYVNHADINNGGGNVFVDSNELPFAPIYMDDARPSVSFNRITSTDGPAISASPDSFDDSLGRIGPDVVGNYLLDNKIDGLFIRVKTPLGSTVDKLDGSGRLDDTDITHVLSETLIVAGGAGGPILDNVSGNLIARPSGRLMIDPGLVFKLDSASIEVERGAGALIAEGDVNRPVIFTSIADDRYGGSGSFNTDPLGNGSPLAGDWGGIFFGENTSGSMDHILIAYGGGSSSIEGGEVNFNALEIHQADVRITNSVFQANADGVKNFGSDGSRNGRGVNASSVIYVGGAQPIIVANTIFGNEGPAISINANSLRYEVQRDSGRSTGLAERFTSFDDNRGPIVRLNEIDDNAINGLLIRGQVLTTDSVWDDTDIVHVVDGEVVVGNHHTYSGLTLQSSNSESLVVKVTQGSNGFTATGDPKEIIDRIGGTIHVLGTVGHPVVLTALADDTVGAGFTPSGELASNTNNSASLTLGSPGDWRGLRFDEFSNDRNVAIIRELENPLINGTDVNFATGLAQNLGVLAPDQKGGDENRRLGFEVAGFISPTNPDDVDVYSFIGTAGTEVWIDIDRTDTNLDAIVEVVNAFGTVLARSVRSGGADPGNLNANTLTVNPFLGGDHYTQNFRDPGMQYVLPGVAGSTGTYFVRVRSNPANTGSVESLAGQSRGEYQLQIRLRQIQEFPGSTVRFSDIRYAATGIDVRGLPAHSPIVGEAGELAGENSETFGTAQALVNLLETDVAALSISGVLAQDTDVDWYSFELTQTDVQLIGGVNDGGGTIGVVFDVDYADGAVRADTTIAVFDEDRNLVYIGRESNVEADQPDPSNPNDFSNLARGSLGKKDPYIGPIHLSPGTEASPKRYYVAIMSDRLIPSAINGIFQASTGSSSTRLEPVNSVIRIVEDHLGFQGYNTLGIPIQPVESDGLFDVSDESGVGLSVEPFSLEDVVLYVATDQFENDNNFGDDEELFTVNPSQSSRWLTRVKEGLVPGVDDIQDIVVRTDGRMYGYQRLNDPANPNAANPNSATVGALVEINPEDGSVTLVGNDNIPGRNPTPNTSIYSNAVLNRFGRDVAAEQVSTSEFVDALTFMRTGTRGPASAPIPEYDLFYVVRDSDTSSKLYRATEDGDATLRNSSTPVPGGSVDINYGIVGKIQPSGVTYETREIELRQPVANAPDPVTNIRLRAKAPGVAGAFDLNISTFRPNNLNVNVNVFGNTISLTIGATGNPISAGPTAQAIVDEINNDPAASQLVVAYIQDGNSNNRGDGAPGTQSIVMTETVIEVGDAQREAPLKGRVTGIAFAEWDSTGNLFGVTNAGEFIEFDPSTAEVINVVDASNTIGVPDLKFEGLSLGPQNAEDGRFANTLFAVTDDGQLVAFDRFGNGELIFESSGNFQVLTAGAGPAGGFFTLSTDATSGGVPTGFNTTDPIGVDAPALLSINETQLIRTVGSGASGTFTLSFVDDLGEVTSPVNSIGNFDTSFFVQDPFGFPSTPFVIQVNSEQMLVTNVAGNRFFVGRGINGTPQSSHPSSASVFEVRTSALTSSLSSPETSSLGSTIDQAATTLAVSDASNFPVTPFTIRVENEEMLVTAVVGNDLTVTRGVNGTVAIAHRVGREVSSVDDNLTVLDARMYPTSAPFNLRINNEDLRVVNVSGNTFSVIRGTNGSTMNAHTFGSIVFNLNTTSALAYDAANSEIEAALGVLPGIGGVANIVVSDGPLSGQFFSRSVKIEFVGELATKDLQPLTGDVSNLVGDEIQRIVLGADVVGGTFELEFNGETTSTLSFDITAADLQAALIALPSIGPNDIVVAGTDLAFGPLDVTFTGDLQDQNVPSLTVPSVTEALLQTELQLVSITGNPNGGNFTLDIDDPTNGLIGSSTAIANNANAAAVLTALESGIPALAGNIRVNGGVFPNGIKSIEFINALGGLDIQRFTVTNNLTGGLAPTVIVDEVRTFDAPPPSILELRPGVQVGVPVITQLDGRLSVRDALEAIPNFSAGDIIAAGVMQPPGTGLRVSFGGSYAGVNVPLFQVDNSLNNPVTNAMITDSSAPGGGGSGSAIMDISGMVRGGAFPIGLAFSPLDFNLWHPTTLRSDDAGHGVNPTDDGTRNPGNEDRVYGAPDFSRDFKEDEGAISYHFGLEPWVSNPTANTLNYIQYSGVNAQYGIRTTEYHADLSSNRNIIAGTNPNDFQSSYNLPGGALGTLTTNTFDLSNTGDVDRPTLYFNYFLDTEAHQGSNLDGDANDPFRDSARVFISRDGGSTWEMVATNSSLLSANDPNNGSGTAELPGFLSHLSDAGLNSAGPREEGKQIVQELHDSTGQWRQARVDLSQYAGLSGLMMRFDFSTAGSMGDETLGRRLNAGTFEPIDGAIDPANVTDEAPYGEFASRDNANARSIRSLNNQFEGIYLDDFIIGYTERGEMVTGSTGDAGITNLFGNDRTRDDDPDQFADINIGEYQLEIRRTGEHIGWDDPDTFVRSIYETNESHVIEGTGLRADRNRERAQGTLILDSNFITDSSVVGINVQPGVTQGGGVPHQGSTIFFPQYQRPNDALIPGVVIQNNVIAGSSGIRFAGETTANPQRPVPFGRIVNNTLVGDSRTGVGIDVVGLAAPTLMNNLIYDFNTGIIDRDPSVDTVIRSNYFQNNASNGSTGTSPIIASTSDVLFLDEANGNYYLAVGSKAIDSSQNTEQDRQDYLTFKTELGISASPINAPNRDVFGQLRVDPNGSPLGDRGAVERTDGDAPYATLLNPVDNDAEGNDLNPSETVVRVTDPLLENFTIFLGDGRGPNSPFEGTGIDGLTVDDPSDDTVSDRAVTVEQNGDVLVQGVDYVLAYNELSGVLRLTPLSTLWEPSSVYVVTLNNGLIADRAGNLLRSNQVDGGTRFTIIIPEVDIDYGDSPDTYRTLLVSDGARHTIDRTGTPTLGLTVDGDENGLPSIAADGDDLDELDNDEDGLVIGTFSNGTTTTDGLFLADGAPDPTSDPGDVVAFLNPNDPAGAVLPITVVGQGVLDAWIDFNADGDFNDLGEKVIDGLAVVEGVNNVRVITPSNAATGLTYARFRISNGGAPLPYGLVIGGEVEDHRVGIVDVDAADAVDDNFYTIDEDHVLTVDGTNFPGLTANDTLPSDDFVESRVVVDGAPVAHPTDVIYRTTNGQVRIDDPALGLFTYTPDQDFVGVDTFRYAVSTQRNEGQEFSDVADFATVSIAVSSFNAPPEFDIPTEIDVLEDAPATWVIEDFFTNVLGGGIDFGQDELDQTVTFTIVEHSANPADLMERLPDVSSGSSIEFFPARDLFGEAVYFVTGTDDGVPVESLTKMFTVSVRLVNDPPRFDPDVAGTGQVNNPDDAYQVAKQIDPGTGDVIDATITYTLREDNSQPVGDASKPYFIPFERDPSVTGYNRVGLMDVFNVGPANEADPASEGGNQSLFMDNVPVNTVLGGSLTVGVNNQGRSGIFYVPPRDYNYLIGGPDSFEYSVIDDGTSYIGGVLVPDPQSSRNTVLLVLNPVNDKPQFDVNLPPADTNNPAGPLQVIEALEDSPLTTIDNFAFNIHAAPPTSAFDEVNIVSGQTVNFLVSPLGFPPAQASDFFSVLPAISPTGRLTFQPAPNAFGIFDFEVVLADDGPNDPTRGDLALSDPVTITIQVLPINDPPVVRTDVDPLAFTIAEDTSIDIPNVGDGTTLGMLDVFAAGPDNESQNLTPGGNQTVSLREPTPVRSAFGGSITQILDNGVLVGLRYTPRVNFVGTDSFTYTVTDDGISVDFGTGGTERPDPRIASNKVTIVVSPINNPPQFSGPSNVNVNEDAGQVSIANWSTNVLPGPPTAIDELSNQDVYFTITQVSGDSSLFASAPVAVIDTNDHSATLQFETATDQNGVATFEVQLFDIPTDGTTPESSSVRVFTLRVNAVNDPPVFVRPSDPVVIDEDSGPYSQAWATNISPGPVDESDQTVRFEVATPAGAETLFQQLPEISDDGVLRFIPAANANGTVDLMVTAIDSDGASSQPTTLRLVITAINDRPTAVADNFATDEDSTLNLTTALLLENDIDPDIDNPGDTLTVILDAESFSLSGAKVLFDSATGQISYDPSTSASLQALSAGEIGSDSFTYRVVDSHGLESNIVSVAVAVTGINDAPVVVDDNPTLNPDGPTIIDVLANDSDIDGQIVPGTMQITLQPAFGTLSIDAQGVVTFTAFQSFSLEDIFRYRVADNDGAFSTEATVTVFANAAPIARDDQALTYLDEPIAVNVVVNDEDPDADPGAPNSGLDLASIQIVGGPFSGQTIALGDGNIRYIPNPGFLGIDSFQYTIADLTGRVSDPAMVQIQTVGSRLQNPSLNTDVNDDGKVSPIDALLVINRLARSGTGSVPVIDTDAGPPYYDVNGDQLISPVDALEVINELSRRQSNSAQGESAEGEQVSVADESAAALAPAVRDFIDLIAVNSDDDDDDERVRALDIAFGDLM